MNRFVILVGIILTILVACGNQSTREAPKKTEEYLTEVAYLDNEGKKYPYFSYETSNGEGLAFFIFPIFEDKNRFLALEYTVGDDVRSLFGEELFGLDGLVVRSQNNISLESFPISYPLNINGKSRWNMTYIDQLYECRVNYENGSVFWTQCTSNHKNLEFVFEKKRGVTRFEKLCERAICTYNLKSRFGLLSPVHLQIIGIIE